MSQRSDLNSKANFSCFRKPEAQSYLEHKINFCERGSFVKEIWIKIQYSIFDGNCQKNRWLHDNSFADVIEINQIS